MPDNEMNADDEFNGVVDRIAEQFARTTVQIDLLCAVDRLVSTAQERGRREGLKAAAKVADSEASKHKEAQHEHTGPHGEAGEEAMMSRASVWACEAVAKTIRDLTQKDSE